MSNPDSRDPAPAPDSVEPLADLSIAPLPTARTVRSRQSLLVQTGRFVIINARMLRMVLRGHH